MGYIMLDFKEMLYKLYIIFSNRLNEKDKVD